MGRADGFQALLDRAAANSMAVSPPVDRIFRPTPNRKENLGRNQPFHVPAAGSLVGGSILGGGEADTSSFGAPGHDAPGQWTEDRRKYGRTTREDSFDWKDEARNRGRSMAPLPLGLRHRETGGESPASSSTATRSSSSYSRNHQLQQSHYPSESLHLRYNDNDERFHSPRASYDGRPTDRRTFQDFTMSRAEYNVANQGAEETSDRRRLDQPQRAHVPPQQQPHHYVLTDAELKLREAEIEVAHQRKEQELVANIEQFERYRQEEADKIDAEHRALNGMRQDVDKRIAMLREVETELHERERTLGEEQKATGEAITDLKIKPKAGSVKSSRERKNWPN
jgi:hypothetical protein